MLVRPNRTFPGTAFIFRGSALEQIWPYLLIIFSTAFVLTMHYEDWGFHRFTLTTIPFSLVGLALSIFLGFRNNACYERWWEARRLWGRLINTSRILAQQTLDLVGPGQGTPEELRAFQRDCIYRMIAFSYSLNVHLRTDSQLDLLASFLPAEELKALESQRNVPFALMLGLGRRYQEAWRAGQIETLHLPLLQQNLVELADIQGGCERIKNTPVPLSYTILTHRIVAIYCFLLPFGIVTEVGNLTPLVVLIVAYAFLGLDSAGSQLEDPFETDPNDLPLNALSRTVEINLRQALGETDIPEPVQPVRGILY